MRSALIAADGSNVVVKNSTLETKDGVQDADYIPSTTLGRMKNVPWMLGLSGNCRATNVLGENTQETFIESSVAAENWGVLSVDDCSAVKVTGINSDFRITGESGYGVYGIGGAYDAFYGCEINVPDYSAILTGGTVTFADSDKPQLEALNQSLDLGLSDMELEKLEVRSCVIQTGRSGIMLHGDGGVVNISGGTSLHSGKAVFLARGCYGIVNADGKEGATLTSDTGVIAQMIDLDKASRVNQTINGVTYNTYPGPYAEPYSNVSEVEKDTAHSLVTADSNDFVGNFSNMTLNGDFYNGLAAGGMLTSRNMVLNFRNTHVTGIISSSFARHEKANIMPEDYKMIGEVTNEPCEAVNNGVLVSLKEGSSWCVTGTSYLTRLELDDPNSLTACEGKTLEMTVDGVATSIKAGTYEGSIVLKLQ